MTREHGIICIVLGFSVALVGTTRSHLSELSLDFYITLSKRIFTLRSDADLQALTSGKASSVLGVN